MVESEQDMMYKNHAQKNSQTIRRIIGKHYGWSRYATHEEEKMYIKLLLSKELSTSLNEGEAALLEKLRKYL